MAHPALEYINTAVALATFFISEDLRATAKNVRDYFRDKKPSPLALEFERDDSVAFIAKLIIDEELLKELSDQVSGAIMEETICVRQATKPTEKDGCARRAERSVCVSLNYIMDRNDGELPTQYLKDKWTGYRCVRV